MCLCLLLLFQPLFQQQASKTLALGLKSIMASLVIINNIKHTPLEKFYFCKLSLLMQEVRLGINQVVPVYISRQIKYYGLIENRKMSKKKSSFCNLGYSKFSKFLIRPFFTQSLSINTYGDLFGSSLPPATTQVSFGILLLCSHIH